MFVLAALPGKPYPAPQVVLSLTTHQYITVQFANQNPDNGGSQII